MTYHEFKTNILNDLPSHLSEDTNLSLCEVTKNNDSVKDSLCITSPEINIGPAFYLNDYYQAYLQGTSYDDILDSLCSSFFNTRLEKNLDFSFYSDFDAVSDRITFRLVHREKNCRRLSELPHLPFLDLAIIFTFLLRADSSGSAAITIKNEHLAMWDVPLSALMDCALENTPRLLPMQITDMNTLLLKHHFSLFSDDSPFFILSNTYGQNGAACLLYPELSKRLEEIFPGDIIIIPSSVNETLLLPGTVDTYEQTSSFLNDMVREVNQTALSPEDILSDHVYLFNRKEGRVVI